MVRIVNNNLSEEYIYLCLTSLMHLSSGLCPDCGTQLYEIIKSGVLRKKAIRPLSILGQCIHGQCIPCLKGGSNNNVGNAAAVALSALADPINRSSSSTAIPTATLVSVSRTFEMESSYSGDVNSFGSYHGNGQLVWKNGDKYKGG